MRLEDIIHKDEYILCEALCEEEISSVYTELEKCREDSLLIIPNSKKIPDFSASDSFPAAVLCDRECRVPSEIPTVRVENPRLAMAYAYSRFYGIDYSALKFIAVTGTNGKTSTATFIKSILRDAGVAVGFIGTGKIELGGIALSDAFYSMTTPDPELLYRSVAKMQNEGCEVIVMEVSSHALALSKVAPIPFEYACFTNLSPEHMDFHGSLEEYYLAKLKLFSKCKTAVFNIDDAYARRAAREFNGRKITVGSVFRGDVFATDIEPRGFRGTDYLYHGENFIFRASLSLPGVYNVYNSMLAAAVCIDMGLAPCLVKKSLSALEGIDGRFEIIKDKITVIIDYAHTDTAVRELLRNVRLLGLPSRKITAVFGCGGERDREKRPRTAAAVEEFADRIIVTSDNSRAEEPMDIISDIIHGFKKRSFSVVERRDEAIREAILGARDGDTVVLIGKGAEKYNIDKEGYHRFDEREIIKSALAERKKRGFRV